MPSDLVVERRSPLPVPPETAFQWHASPGALERLFPPWMRLEVRERTSPELRPGSRVRFRIKGFGPFSWKGVHGHPQVEPGRGFTDVQLEGPFDRWVHHHQFDPDPDRPGQSILTDRIECSLPFGFRIGRDRVRRELERTLAYRHAITAADLAMHSRSPSPPLHIGITGASGFLGSILGPLLTAGGHRVTPMVRRPAREGERQWAGRGFALGPGHLAGLDAVVHLAGENIAVRWTEARKQRIRKSRAEGTALLARAAAAARDQGGPSVLVTASAIGFYGDRGDEALNESSPAGEGFLPEVAELWEGAPGPAEAAGLRIVRVRIGLPLSPAGGLLERILLPFRLGLGGRLGSGKQWMSWIGADDLLEIFFRAVTEPGIRGAVNATAPAPVRNREFTSVLAGVLRRPAIFPVPRIALRAVFGEMADEAILASARVIPAALLERGHRFRHPELEAALRHVLGR